jgi:predicted ABC-type ATPase
LADKPRIDVLAGTNGAGKSSILGAATRGLRAAYFNPDEAARAIQNANQGVALAEANAAAWAQRKRLLERAMAERLDYALETTLGGDTYVALLRRAGAMGFEVRVQYVGLASPELHIARVAARVAKGGHDIPEDRIRYRYDKGREHLLELLPVLTELKVYDNSLESDPDSGRPPSPLLVLHLRKGKIRKLCEMSAVPDWAKPIVAAALAR